MGKKVERMEKVCVWKGFAFILAIRNTVAGLSTGHIFKISDGNPVLKQTVR